MSTSAHPSRFALSLAACLALVSACTQKEPPPRASATPTSTAVPAGNSGQPKSKAARCTAPFSAVPLPPAPPAAACPSPDTPLTELATGSLRFVDAPAAPSLRVERAENDADRSRGLMYRTAMDEDRGMLFTWPDQRTRSFWMKNTCLSLDMLFIDKDDFIVGILEQVPTLNEHSRRVPCPAKRVLEVNAGFSRRYGITPGQRIDVDF